MVMKKILIALALLLTGIASGSACTGISFLAEDGGYVQARTIEWGNSYLPSEYVIVPRGQDLVSYTPTGVNGLRFRAKYGMVGSIPLFGVFFYSMRDYCRKRISLLFTFGMLVLFNPLSYFQSHLPIFYIIPLFEYLLNQRDN